MLRKSFVLMVVGTVIFFLCSVSSADLPDSINYQGKLTTASGGCLNDTVSMTFSIYPDTLPGTPADWTETQAQVVVKEGIFNVLLGSVNSLPTSLFDGSAKYLGVQVESDPEMRPLKPMVSVAYAYRAGVADSGMGGWVDDGTVVRLEDSTDAVGIGTTTPNAQLQVSTGRTYAGYFTTDSAHYATAVHGEYTGTGGWSIGVYGKAAPGGRSGYGGSFEGGYIGVHSIVNQPGNTAGYAVYGLIKQGTSGDYGVMGWADEGGGNKYGIYGKATGSGTNYGVCAQASGGTTNWAGYFYGNVHATGNLSKGGGGFKIDHPLDPENKYLYHSFVESPDMKNLYDGMVLLDANGEAVVELPDYFEAVNKDFRYQLTAIGAPAANLYIAEEISDDRFRIAGGEPGMRVSWQVTGIRKDPFAEANRIQVEVDKPVEERGKYLHPQAYGLEEEYGIGYEEHKRLEEDQKRMEMQREKEKIE